MQQTVIFDVSAMNTHYFDNPDYHDIAISPQAIEEIKGEIDDRPP